MYFGGCSVLLRWFSSMELVQYYGRHSVLWRMSELWKDTFCGYCERIAWTTKRMLSTCKDNQYYGECSVKDIQYWEDVRALRGYHQWLLGWNSMEHYGGCSVLLKKISTKEDVQYRGWCSVQLRIFSTVEDVRTVRGYHLWLLGRVRMQHYWGCLVLLKIFSTVEEVRVVRRYHQWLLERDSMGHYWGCSVLLKIIST